MFKYVHMPIYVQIYKYIVINIIHILDYKQCFVLGFFSVTLEIICIPVFCLYVSF